MQAVLTKPIPMAEPGVGEIEMVVRRHARFVYEVAYAVLGNHHDAEDAAQDTFVRVLRHASDWGQVRNERAWLARVAWRVALSRKTRRVDSSLEEATQQVLELRAIGAGADEIASRREMQSLLTRLIATLPRKLREPLTLAGVEEMNSGEIAAVLGIPEGSVRNRILRARQLLKEKLSVLLERKHGR